MAINAEVTRLLIEWNSGSKDAADLLMPLVYEELRRLARSYLRNESAAATIQPTALVHEAYVRLVGQSLPDWQSRAHFFGVAAHLMRQVLVDHARRHHSKKRGSGIKRLSVDEALDFAPGRGADVIALDDALTALESMSPRQCKVIELRYFAGFTVEETAQTLGISVATAGRDQRLAEAWLHRELSRAQSA